MLFNKSHKASSLCCPECHLGFYDMFLYSSSNNFISIKFPPGWKFNKKLNCCERCKHDLTLPTVIPRPCKCISSSLRVNN